MLIAVLPNTVDLIVVGDPDGTFQAKKRYLVKFSGTAHINI